MKRSLLLEELTRRILRVERPHTVRVAIDGVDGAGKTTLADELANRVQSDGTPAIRASVDGFHRPRAYRYRRGRESPSGYYHDSFDYWKLKTVLLQPLGPGGDGLFRTAVFDHRADLAVEREPRRAEPRSVLLFDGVFLLRPEIADCWDYRIFVDTTFPVASARACERDARDGDDPDTLRRLYDKRYVAGQQLYLEQCDPRESADAVVLNDDLTDPSLRPM